MTKNKTGAHPNFIIGMVSYLLLISGVTLYATGLNEGKTMVLGSVVLGALHWVKAICDVVRDPYLKGEGDHYVWFQLVLIIPPIGGMMYYITQRNGRGLAGIS